MGVIDNSAAQRFELVENGSMAFADYARTGDTIVILHVEAAIELRGTGAAGRLMLGVLSHVRKAGLKVRPRCGYAVAYLNKHPEDRNLLA